tara:strand:+ start:244 stop:945 length:702 start_codon:yes stop_codon:yes gene_type:complete
MFNKILKIFKCFCNLQFIKAYIYLVCPLFEIENLLKKIKKCRTLIDVGSNKGQFSILFRNYFHNTKIYSFEPQSDQIAIQKKILGVKNISYSKLGISDFIGNKNFYVTKRKDSSSVHRPKSNEMEIYNVQRVDNIKMTTLDNFFKNKKIKKPVVLKLDIQGHEFEALKGSQKTLKKIDYIIIELSYQKKYFHQINYKKIDNFLLNNSFQQIYQTNIIFHKNKIFQLDALYKKN